MEDDRLLSCAFCAGMLPCLADRHPILEAACKHFRLRENLGECVIIVDGREHGISHPAEMHRLEAASGHSNRTYICKMYFVRIGLLLDRLDDVHALMMFRVDPMFVYRVFSGYASAAGDTIAPMCST